jgi:hypothetical protein
MQASYSFFGPMHGAAKYCIASCLLTLFHRCRQFPSLINCTTIIWFSPWPSEALLGVGVRFLEQLSLSPGAMQLATAAGAAAAASKSTSSRPVTPLRPTAGLINSQQNQPPAVAADAADAATGQQQSLVQRIAQLCVEVHKSVEAAAERLYQEVKRS